MFIQFTIHSLYLAHFVMHVFGVLSLCDCDYVLLYYFDLVIRSAGSQNTIFWWRAAVNECVLVVVVRWWWLWWWLNDCVCVCLWCMLCIWVMCVRLTRTIQCFIFMCFSYLLPMTHRDNYTCFSLSHFAIWSVFFRCLSVIDRLWMVRILWT